MDIPIDYKCFSAIPRSVRGYTPTDFLFFKWNPSIESAKSRILLENLSGEYTDLGPLKEKVYVPAVFWPHDATLIVTGRNRKDQEVRHVGLLRRGQLYVLPESQQGVHKMQRFNPQN